MDTGHVPHCLARTEPTDTQQVQSVSSPLLGVCGSHGNYVSCDFDMWCHEVIEDIKFCSPTLSPTNTPLNNYY